MSIFALLKKNRERRNEAAFSALIEEPGDVSSGLVMPANGILAISASVASVGDYYNEEEEEMVPGEIQIDVSGRAIGLPDLDADQIRKIGYFEKGKTITVSTSLAADVNLYLVRQNGTLSPIGAGTYE
jgi:hypothetical protein